MKIIVPLLVIVGIATLVGALMPALMMRGKAFKPGNYGAAGGAVLMAELLQAEGYLQAK